MKNKITTLLITIITLLLSISCGVNIEERKPTVHLENCGSITVNENLKTAAHYLDVSNTIKFAKATVSGTGIKAGSEPTVTDINVTDGKGSFTINNVPAGKNRIVTVQALDASKKEVFQITLRAVVDVEVGKTAIIDKLTWATTALGNVFYELHKTGYNLLQITKDNLSSIQNVIDTSRSPFLINSEQIALDFSSSALKQDANMYFLESASLNYTLADSLVGMTVQVCDPLSNVQVASSTTGTINNIAPGKWKVCIIDDAKNVKHTLIKDFKYGRTTEANFSNITDKIILHVYGYTHIWAWNQNGIAGNLFESWPGELMTDEENDYKGYTLEDTTSINLIFSNNGNGQTANLTLDTPGEWWYKDGKFEDSDPTDFIAPSIISFTADKTENANGLITFTVDAQDNKALSKAVVYLDEALYKEYKFTSVSDVITFQINSSLLKNGSHSIKVKVKDSSNNESAFSSLSFTTQNENLKPVAVITGSSYVNFDVTKEYSASNSYDLNGIITSYSWSVTGATITSGANSKVVTIKFPSTASQCVLTLTVTDDENATNIITKNIEVKKVEVTDFREEAIYFAITTRFYDGDLSNNVHCWDENPATAEDDPSWRGDFKGLIEKLDYIKALGFTAVWITPVVENSSGMDYHGYHAMNFSKVDPRYESSDVDFQTLIDEVHARDMKLVLDVVFNHTGNFGEDTLAPMFVKDYSADLEDINACLKLHPNTLLDDSYWDLAGAAQYQMRLALMKNTDGVNHDTRNYYHHYGHGNWDTFSSQWMQIAGDCVDLNTENPAVLNYIVKAYSQYIKMGVDAFRIDTGKHIPRLVFNKVLNDAFMQAAEEAGNPGFYMFSEICARANEVIYRETPNMSACFYTWKEDKEYPWDNSETSWNDYVMFETEMLQSELESGSKMFEHTNAKSCQQQGLDYAQGTQSKMLKSDNHLLKNNTYREPDYSMHSGLNVIDFPMHWNFNSASGAFSVHGGDEYYNDATWNVVYVDSHDYAPSDDCFNRYNKGTDAWAENISLMFTFRGIPCLYYGSEVEFMAGAIIDKGPLITLAESGRAYFGDHIEGNVNVTDFGVWSEATGAMKETLESPLAKHLSRMGQIRRAIPALQKGQYSTENCSGSLSFKRRYTKGNVDSFVLVTISGNSTFTNIPSGIYIDVITGDTQTISEGGTITATCSGKGNARIYVLQNETASNFGANGKIGSDGVYLK